MFDAYGDESCGPEYIAYGVALFPEARITQVEKILNSVKLEFGGQPSHTLHCRELFAGDVRKKSSWSHLDQIRVFELYERLLNALREVTPKYLSVTAKKSLFPRSLPPLELEHVDANFVGPRPYTKAVLIDDKFLVSQCAMGAMIPLARDIGLSHFRVWPDPDQSLITWFDGRRSMERALSAFIQTGPNREALRLNIMRFTEKPKLLEIADLVAYVSQRVHTNKHSPNGRRFAALFRAIAPTQIKFAVGSDGGFGFSVPQISII